MSRSCNFLALVPILQAMLLAGLCGCSGSGSTGDEAIHLTYWRALTGASGVAQDELVRRFNESQTDVRVTSEFQGSYSDLATKLTAAIVARSGPDVTQLGTFEIRQFAEAGALADLKPYLEGADGIDTGDWPATMARAGEIDGGVYWLPFNVAVPVLYYNQDAVAEAGLDGAPATWNEFFNYARSLTKRSDSGTVERHGLALWNITWPLFSMIWSEGGELTTRDYSNITLNDPVVGRLLEELQRLVKEGDAIMPDKASGGHRAAFQNGRAAMILDSQDAFAEIFNHTRDFTPALALYPAGAKGRVYAPGGGGLAMLANTPPERRDAAWHFIRFMLAPEQLTYYARESGYLAFTESSRNAAGDLLADPRYATIHEALEYVRADFSVNMSPEIRAAFDEAYRKILVQGADVQATLDAADAQAENAVRQQRSRP